MSKRDRDSDSDSDIKCNVLKYGQDFILNSITDRNAITIGMRLFIIKLDLSSTVMPPPI